MTEDDSKFLPPFEALKAEDRRTIRPFSSYWAAALQNAARQEAVRHSANHPGRWSPNFQAIAAALALLIIGAIVIHTLSPRQERSQRISLWRSPTASLLNMPGNQLFIGLPRMGEPLIPSSIPSIKEQRN